MEHGDIEKMQVESIAAYVTAIGGHLRMVPTSTSHHHHHLHRLHRRAHRLSIRAQVRLAG
jgi:hypothetical protein